MANIHFGGDFDGRTTPSWPISEEKFNCDLELIRSADWTGTIICDGRFRRDTRHACTRLVTGTISSTKTSVQPDALADFMEVAAANPGGSSQKLMEVTQDSGPRK
jgi:hypothetical protein